MLVINLLGLVTGPIYGTNGSNLEDPAIDGYHRVVRKPAELTNLLNKPVQEFDLGVVNSVVFESLMHSNRRRVQPQENWLMWLAGIAYEPASKTQDAKKVVAGGRAICSEATLVVNEIARLNGLNARVVALNGHVVAEVQTEDGWQVADPDYGLVFEHDLMLLESGILDSEITSQLTQRGFSARAAESYTRFYTTTDDNLTLEVGAVPSPRLAQFESIADILIWLLPLGLLIFPIAHKLRR